jgi:hypothetical protein
MELIKHYPWLAAGLGCVWLGLISLYVIYATGSPSTPATLIFVAPFCFYKFIKARTEQAQSNPRLQ